MADFRVDYLCLWSVAYGGLRALLKQFMDNFGITDNWHPGKHPNRMKDGGSDGHIASVAIVALLDFVPE
jgi:hypothetical protein